MYEFMIELHPYAVYCTYILNYEFIFIYGESYAVDDYKLWTMEILRAVRLYNICIKYPLFIFALFMFLIISPLEEAYRNALCYSVSWVRENRKRQTKKKKNENRTRDFRVNKGQTDKEYDVCVWRGCVRECAVQQLYSNWCYVQSEMGKCFSWINNFTNQLNYL